MAAGGYFIMPFVLLLYSILWYYVVLMGVVVLVMSHYEVLWIPWRPVEQCLRI